MIHFLKLICWKNLLLIAIAQYAIKYAFLLPFTKSHGVYTTLNHFHFFLLVFSTICITASGYLINAVYSIEVKAINNTEETIIKKTITEKDGFTIFMILTIVGVVLGFYLSNYVGKSSFFVLFFASSALLYTYASALKQMFLIGNIVIALVFSLLVFSIGIFELLPVITFENKKIQFLFFNIIRDYGIFILLLSFLNELVKDIRDIGDDYKVGMQTLPIVFGRERATKIAFSLTLIIVFAIVYYLITYLFTQQLVMGYFLIFVIAPLIYSGIKLFSATQNTHYEHISKLLNLVILTGILSLVLYKFVIT